MISAGNYQDEHWLSETTHLQENEQPFIQKDEEKVSS